MCSLRSEKLLPTWSAQFVTNRTDLPFGSIFILSINDVMFIIASIVIEGKRFMSIDRR